MDNLDDPFELQQGILRSTLPLGVLQDLSTIGEEVRMNQLFPGNVVEDIIHQWGHPVVPHPLPNLQVDVWMKYIDRTVENRYLEWEAEFHKLKFAFCSLLFFCCFLLHLYFCSTSSLSTVKQSNWPCIDSQVSFILATLLIWIPICASLLPNPMRWQYKELIFAVHQFLFGILLSLFQKELATEHSHIETNLVLICILPVLIESLIFRIRLQYHIPLSVVMASLVLSPWLNNDDDDDDGSIVMIRPLYELIVNLVALLVIPTCLVALYESFLRKKFERTL